MGRFSKVDENKKKRTQGHKLAASHEASVENTWSPLRCANEKTCVCEHESAKAVCRYFGHV